MEKNIETTIYGLGGEYEFVLGMMLATTLRSSEISGYQLVGLAWGAEAEVWA